MSPAKKFIREHGETFPAPRDDIAKEVRHRDEERLALQEAEGIAAGLDKILTKPVKPEPLVKPKTDNIEGKST